MIKELFEYIENELKNTKTVSLDTWGSNVRSGHYYAMAKLYDADSPIINFNGNNYIITFHDARLGMGGMDEGSPDTINIRRVGKVKEIKSDRPTPVANPDFSFLIINLEATMDQVVSGDYHEDNDDDHYIWEEAMKAVYGKNIFDWWNENVN